MAIDVGSAKGQLDLDISGFLTGLKRAQEGAASSAATIEQQFGNKLQSAGSKLSSAGMALTTGLTLPLVGAAAAGLKVSTDFDYAMSQVEAISGATGKEFDALRNQAIKLGADTAFSATEVANAMTEMAKAGWSSQDIMSGMAGVLNAAAASGTGLATTSTIMADAISGFGLQASEAQRVADLLTQSANAGTIGIEDLGESFKYIAPVAHTMGYSIEDVTTAVTAMSTAGIKGSQAGTALRTMLTRMVKPTDTVKAAMDELGISLTNSDGSFKPLNQSLAEMRAKFNGLTDEQKAYYAATLAGQEGMSGMLALLNMSQDEYDKIADSMNNASGVAEETASTMQDNLKSGVEQLTGSLETLAIKLADLVVPKLREIVDKATEWVNAFSEMDSGTQEFILKLAGIVAIAGPVLVIVGKLMSGFGSLIKVIGDMPGALEAVGSGFTMFKNFLLNIPEAFTLAKAGFTGFASQTSVIGTALAGITAPMIAIVAVIAVLVAAFVHLWNTNEDFRNSIIGIWNQIQEAVSRFVSNVQERLEGLGAKLQPILDELAKAWDAFCQFLAPVFKAAFQIIADVFSGILDVLTGILDVFIGIFTGDWKQAWQGVQEIFKGVWDTICNVFRDVGDMFLGIWDVIGESITDAVDTVVTAVSDFFAGLPDAIGNFLQSVIDAVTDWATNLGQSASQAGSDFVSNVTSFMQNLPYTIGYILGYAIGTVIGWSIQFAQNAMQAGSDFVQGVISFIQNLPTNVMGFLNSVVSSAISFASDFAGQAAQAGSQFVQNVISFLQGLPGRVTSFFSSIISSAISFVSSFASQASQAASQFGSNIVSGLSSIPGRVASIGMQIVQGIANGIRNAAGAVTSALKGVVDGAINGIKHTLGIASPSKKMRDEVGRWMPPGITAGFLPEMKKTTTAMQLAINEGVGALKVPQVGIAPTKADFESLGKFSQKMKEMKESGLLLSAKDGMLYDVSAPEDDEKYNRKDDDKKPDARDGGGDTYNFYTNKAIDEVEAARQIERMKWKMSEEV